MPDRTPTSYAILGLLNLRPHTAYELAAQSQRSLRFTWPTAESRLYAEPKRLVADGLISVEEEPAGPTRTRQRYRITDEGRAALRAWLATPPSPPRAELEFLLRVLLADGGDVDQLRASIDATRTEAEGLYEAGFDLLRSYRDDAVAYPERMHLNMLWIVFVRELLQLIVDWTEFAEGELRDVGTLGELGESDRAHELLATLLAGEPVLRR